MGHPGVCGSKWEVKGAALTKLGRATRDIVSPLKPEDGLNGAPLG